MGGATYTLAALVERFGGHVVRPARAERDESPLIVGLCSIARPSSGRIAALLDARYARHVVRFAEGVLLVEVAREDVSVPQWVHPDVRRVFRTLAATFSPFPERGPARIGEGAVVDPRAQLGADVVVGSGALIGADVWVGDGATIGAGAILEPGVIVGRASWVGPGAVLVTNVVLGERVVVGPRAVLGGQGFGFDTGDDGRRIRILHIGGVTIADDVEVGGGGGGGGGRDVY